jgi:hypothetical protein
MVVTQDTLCVLEVLQIVYLIETVRCEVCATLVAFEYVQIY